MTNDPVQRPAMAAEPPTVPELPFRAVLTPHRSLSPTGFVILMSAIASVSFVAGTVFLLMGAWPVFGFFGLDVLLIYLAFRLNYRSGRRSETIEISREQLRLTRIDERGHHSYLELNPYWANITLAQAKDGRTRLALASHGRAHAFGLFLTDDERRDLAKALQAALLAARATPRI